MSRRRCSLFGLAGALGIVLSACASASPPPPVVTPTARVTAWDEKIAWIVRLEDQRVLRDPAGAGERTAPSDLVALLEDREAGVRARAALALGRVGLPEAIEPLSQRLQDEQVDVRQTAAFALGLIGDPGARPALRQALADRAPLVQGRAAEALGLIGDRDDVPAIAAIAQAHVKAGALAGLDPDDLSWPLAAPVEAVRLSLYALARLGSFEALASVALDTGGLPVTRWWPVAYAFQRVNDARTVPWLLALLETPGRFTASFAAKGLAVAPSDETIAALRRIVDEQQAHPMVIVQAVRTLAASGATAATPALLRLLADRTIDPAFRLEVMEAFGTLAEPRHVDALLDLLSHPMPGIRASATRALARLDQDALLSALASLETDPEWTVRVAQAQALGTLPPNRGGIRLVAMVTDADTRVIPAVLAALAASKSPVTAPLASERLSAEDFVVRAAAATALADVAAASSVPALVQAYRASLADETYVARGAILSALHRLDRQASRPVLEEALRDRDWAVRVRAATLLGEQGATGRLDEAIRPAAPGRPVDDPEWHRILVPPYAPRAFIETDKGTIELELAIVDAPITTASFMTLARRGFFDGRVIHRVVPDFVVQDGDPRGDGEGGPGYTLRDEINQRPYLRGTVGMALDWRDTGGSQFFITHSPQPHLDARYTVFGQVVSGLEVVDRLAASDVIRRVRIWDGVTP